MPRTAPGATGQSLRWRLLRAVFATALLVWGLVAILSYDKARHEAEELMDGHLAHSARLLLALVRDNESLLADLATRLALARSGEDRPYESPLEFQIGRADGSLLLRSEQAPASSLAASPGYENITHHGHPWRVLTIAAPADDYRVQVAQSIDVRDRAALEVASQTVLPIALISPLLLLLIYLSVRGGLKPLDDLAADVAARSPENLKPLANHAAPLEVQPLLAALNQLLVRLAEALDKERRFTADAAHELRTPLAVIKIQAEVAQLSRNPDDRQHALKQIVLGVDRATRVLEQLLRLARLDPLTGLPKAGAVDLGELAHRVLVETRVTADAGAIHLHASLTPLIVQGDGELLAIVLRNLLDNALRYTPPGTTVTLFVRRQNGDILLAVADDGPGVSPEDLPRLVERFYRGREVSAEGSGLGLAIVQRIAELHSARFEVENLSGGGFEARLRWVGSAEV
ncbi:MAG: sensor histidine kinase N-terminal domain-containing protein [Candidatus Accumulibacter sp.]|uniref:ATP-binding protein n=1 Tax=Accumulibacter sp. TaxID=2053492 RepID=UPI00258E45A0|nr:ATP-binding protein [Accumulibacter sp.]MCM8623612.1 sensor histidine kinase N-terminal domain-containing protein [Accumulibacter sp.]